MPDALNHKRERRSAIANLLALGPAPTQQAVVEALLAQGFDATQSSVSRDLRELGALKTPAGYVLADTESDGKDEIAAVAALVRGLKAAGPHLLVIHTAVGAAQRVALALDRCGWPGIVGSVGGDDTVFTATSDGTAQRNVITRFERCVARGA